MSIGDPYAVSTIITSYGRGELLRQCLTSLFDEIAKSPLHLQPLLNDVIVVDDGSPNELESALREFRQQIRFFRLNENRGRAAAKNYGLLQARNSLISYLDSDDLCARGRFEHLLAPFFEDEKLECSIGGVENFIDGENLNSISSGTSEGAIPGCMLIRKAALDRIGDFNVAYKSCDFGEWFSRFLAAHVFYRRISSAVLLRRVHEGNSSLEQSEVYWSELFGVLRGRIVKYGF